MATNSQNKIASSSNFIRAKIEKDISNNLYKNKLWNKSPGNSNHQLKGELDKAKIRTRFPPEPNGYLHIGHTKAIGISFGLGEKYQAPVNLRFDDTNPAKEEQKYVDAIKEDIAWMGYQWDQEVYSSDYFQQLYDWAVQMIRRQRGIN